MQILYKIVASIVLCILLFGFGFFAIKRIWSNNLDPFGFLVDFFKTSAEKIPVVKNPINVEPNSFHIKKGHGKIMHFSITNNSDKRLHSIWTKVWSENVSLSDKFARFDSEKLTEIYSHKLSENMPKFNYLAMIVSAIDENNNYCRYIHITTLNSKQKIEFKIIANENISKERTNGVDINLKYLAHSLNPPDIKINKNEILIGTKMPESGTLKGVSYYFGSL